MCWDFKDSAVQNFVSGMKGKSLFRLNFPLVLSCIQNANYTATAIPFIYSFSGNSTASTPISTFMCLWAIYIFPGSVYTYFLQQNRQTHRGNIHIIRSQTHECGNWDWGPDIPFLGIFVSNFRHFVFAVQQTGAQQTKVRKFDVRNVPSHFTEKHFIGTGLGYRV